MQSWDVNRTPGRTSQKTQDHLSLVPLSETQTFAFLKLCKSSLAHVHIKEAACIDHQSIAIS